MKLFGYLTGFILAIGFTEISHSLDIYDDELYHPRSNKVSVVDKSEDKEFWRKEAQATLDWQLGIKIKEKQAKNVIFFLGDGMSLSTVTSARVLKGTKTGKFERESLSWEAFEFGGLSRTFSTDKQVTDSAASATSFLTGVKGNQGVIGLDVNSIRGDCSTQLNESIHTDSIAKWFQDAGRSAGVVTTTRITHATPAGSYVHIAERYWEDDKHLADDGADPNICDDVAEQLVLNDPGKYFKVILGGGRDRFFRNDQLDIEDGIPGYRADGKNLVDTWLEDKAKQNLTASYVWNKEDLFKVDIENTDHLLGLFAFDHMDTALNRNQTMDPSLPEMTEKAIQMLSKDENGYFLLVEGGLIDIKHHDNEAQQSLHEALELEEAVARALNMTDPEETIILVTADHGQPLNFNGYADRQSDIFGIADESHEDKRNYTILNYGTGPGFKIDKDGKRYEPTADDIANKNYAYSSGVPMDSSTHDGTDVGIWVTGPFAHLFTSVYESNYIPHALAYAACVGNGRTFCNDKK